MKAINEFLINNHIEKIKHTQDEVYKELGKLRDMIINVLENTLETETLQFNDEIQIVNTDDYSANGAITGIRKRNDIVEVNVSWNDSDGEWEEFTPEQFHVEDMCWVLDNIIEKNYKEV